MITASVTSVIAAGAQRRWQVLWLLVLLSGCSREVDTTSLLALNDFEYVISDSRTPPAPDAGWQPFRLPLGTRYADPANSNLVYWLRTQIRRPADAALQGLYFYRYNKSIDLWFNGDYIGGDNHVAGRDTVAWNHPQLVTIQPANWQGGDNELLIRLQTSRLGGVFAGALLGNHDQLEVLYQQRYFRQITVNEWLLSFGFLVTLLATLLWQLRRRDSLYWQFALVSACWMLITYHMVAYQTPLPDRWWLPLVHIGIDGWLFALGLFMMNWFGLQRPRQLRWHGGLLLIATIWHALALLPYWWMTAYLLHAAGFGFIVVLLYHGIRRRLAIGGRMSILAAVLLVQLACMVHDLYALVLRPVPDWESGFHWSQFAFPLVQGIFLVMLIQRFVSALTLAEGLNLQLEARVAAARQELEAVYARAREAEVQKAADEERSRIYRDLHDDVGSKLLSIAHAGRETRLGALASAALESLREAVGRANNPETAFGDFLQGLQEEMSLRLSNLGIALSWTQPQQGLDWRLASSQNYHLTRLFRELVSNIIRHAGATEVSFGVLMAGDGWLFTLTDNGRGFDTGQSGGNGMRNLRSRADELGAGLRWASGAEGGVVVTLWLPVPSMSPPAG